MPTINLTRNNTLNNTKENTMNLKTTGISFETRKFVTINGDTYDVAKLEESSLIGLIERVRDTRDALAKKNIESTKIKAKIEELDLGIKELITELDAR